MANVCLFHGLVDGHAFVQLANASQHQLDFIKCQVLMLSYERFRKLAGCSKQFIVLLFPIIMINIKTKKEW